MLQTADRKGKQILQAGDEHGNVGSSDFFTMLFYASCFLEGELENSEAATQWAFEQIYSFVVPNVKAEVLGEEVTL